MSENGKDGVRIPFYSYHQHPALDAPYPLVSCITQETFESAVNFKPDPGDIFLTSFPKSGTTWLMNIMYLLRNDGVPVAKGDCIDKYVPFLEFDGGKVVRKQANPRLIKSHLYYKVIPQNPDAKYIFVARNPKDVVSSFYYHTIGFDYYKFKDGSFDDFFEVFMDGVCDFGDYFNLVPEWWQKSLQQDNIYFMLYEDMKNDIKGEILKMAEFLGDSSKIALEKNNGELLNKVLEFSSFSKMQKAVGAFCPEIRPKDVPFVRKGVIGDWKNRLSRDQSDRIDKRLAEAGNQFSGFDKLWSKYDELLKFNTPDL